MTESATLVGMGDLLAGGSTEEFGCLGIGSGVVLAAYDPQAKVGGCAHFFLPSAPKEFDSTRPAKYVDTGVEALMNRMRRLGAKEENIRVALVGGASVITSDATSTARMDLGMRNVDAAHRALEANGLRCLMEDLGGQIGRSLTLSTRSGEVRIRTSVHPEKVLGKLQG